MSTFDKETNLSRGGHGSASANREATPGGNGGPNRGNSFVVGVPANMNVGGGGGGSAELEKKDLESAARAFMYACGLECTPDAVAQLTEVFLPCLKIMCGRPWDPNGGTWRRSGRLGILGDVRKKFERLWERGWIYGKRHDDSGFDLINFIGFYMRSDKTLWGEWGEPYSGPEE